MAALLSCVGDDPTDATSDTGDGGEKTDGGGLDVQNPGDTGFQSDTSTPLDPCAGAAACPSRLNGPHLQLWLRSDLGVDCSSAGRVTAWRDQSGHNRGTQSSLYLDGGSSLAPQCQIEKINTRPVVSFTDPTMTAPPYNDETSTVDLGFLGAAPSGYTIFVVYKPTLVGDLHVRGLLGEDRIKNTNSTCPGPFFVNDGTIDLSFVDTDAGVLFDYNHYAAFGFCARALPSNSVIPEKVSVVTLTFDPASGHRVNVDGTDVFTPVGATQSEDLVGTNDGGTLAYIGREAALDAPLDNRFHGDIAEIIVYDIPLGSEIPQMKNYFSTTWGL